MVSTKRPPAWLFGLMGAVVVAGFAYGTYTMWSNDIALSERGQRASARVVDTVRRDEVEFRTPDGRQFRSLIGQRVSGPEPALDEQIEIVYDPADPSSDVDDVRATNDRTVTFVMLGITTAAAVAIPMLTWRLARQSGRRRST
ncbi:DUF3592 domain-containing protein [Actinosynnema sp. NPDC047251]|uniref:DUF3592 domain-containing protein n=1 Tax=Saccharothrix espanaensis TaxID=103731 RepID=UPI0011DD64C4|nr:DUF3592 domain-containing protein [Saccharothrix espanaensis]